MKKDLAADLAVYSDEALRLAANVVEGVRVGAGGRLQVEGADPDAIFSEFMNEALNQQCRIDLVKRNYKTSQLILANALVSALGQKK